MSNSIAGVWVKADARLPKIADRYFIKVPVMGLEKRVATFNGKCFEHEFTNKDFEWLDEQPILVKLDEDEFADWMEVNNGIGAAIAVFNECKITVPEDHPDPTAINDCISMTRDAQFIFNKLKKKYLESTPVQEGLREVDKIRKEHGAYIWAFPIKYRSEAGLVYQEDYGWEIEFEDGKVKSYGYSGEPTVPNYESALLQAIEYFYKQSTKREG